MPSLGSRSSRLPPSARRNKATAAMQLRRDMQRRLLAEHEAGLGGGSGGRASGAASVASGASRVTSRSRRTAADGTPRTDNRRLGAANVSPKRAKKLRDLELRSALANSLKTKLNKSYSGLVRVNVAVALTRVRYATATDRGYCRGR